jgi:hypothetical protein
MSLVPGLNPAEGMDVRLCDRVVTPLEESYQVCSCVCVCFDMDMSYTRVLHKKVAYRVPHK